MKIGSAHRVMVRPLALLALACAVSLFIGVEGAAAQSDDINEAVNAHGHSDPPVKRTSVYHGV
jgi:hypothetical protein